jgi:hypothetical protein
MKYQRRVAIVTGLVADGRLARRARSLSTDNLESTLVQHALDRVQRGAIATGQCFESLI